MMPSLINESNGNLLHKPQFLTHTLGALPIRYSLKHVQKILEEGVVSRFIPIDRGYCLSLDGAFMQAFKSYPVTLVFNFDKLPKKYKTKPVLYTLSGDCKFYELDDCYLAGLNLLFETEVRINENIRLDDVDYVVVNSRLPLEEKTEIEKILEKKGIRSKTEFPKTRFCEDVLKTDKIIDKWWSKGTKPELESEDFQKYLGFLFDYNRFVAGLFGVDYQNAIKESRNIMGGIKAQVKKEDLCLDSYDEGIITCLDREKYCEMLPMEQFENGK